MSAPMTTTTSDNAWLTVQEIARYLRVSKMTVYRLVESGELPSVRVGRSIRIHASAYRRWMAAR